MFCLFVDQYKYPEVFVLTETWFNDCNVQDIPLYNAYHALRIVNFTSDLNRILINDILQNEKCFVIGDFKI